MKKDRKICVRSSDSLTQNVVPGSPFDLKCPVWGNARRIAQAKVGFNLTAHEVRHGALLEGATALTNDTAVQANAHQLAMDFAVLGGAEKAAEALENILP